MPAYALSAFMPVLISRNRLMLKPLRRKPTVRPAPMLRLLKMPATYPTKLTKDSSQMPTRPTQPSRALRPAFMPSSHLSWLPRLSAAPRPMLSVWKALRLMMCGGLMLMAATACSKPPLVVRPPVFIPSTAMQSCLPQPLNPNEHFESLDAVTKRIADDGIDLAGELKKCDGKRQGLITAISGNE